MKKEILIITLALLTLFSNCKETKIEKSKITVDSQSNPVFIKFELEREIDLREFQYPFLRIIDKNIWIYGRAGKKADKIIDMYSQGLQFLDSKTLQYGQGPGDIGVLPMIFDGGKEIYISDHSQFRVTVFDKELHYKRMVKTPKNFVCISTDDEFKHILFCKYDRSKDGLNYKDYFYISTFPEQKITKYHTIGPFTRYFMKNGKPSVVLSEDQYFHYFIHNASIYFLDASKYEILKFDLDGNLLKSLIVEYKPISMPDDPKILEGWLEEHNRNHRRKMFYLGDNITPASHMIKLKNGFIVVRRKGWSIGCEGFIESDYFDYNLEFKGKVSVPCFYRMFINGYVFFPYTSQYFDGNFYLIQERGDRYVLQKWRVLEINDEA